MPSCIIKGCFNTWKTKDSNVILHVFPKDKDGIKLWLSQSPENFPNVDELVEKVYSQNKYGTVRLCSKHFNDDQYFHEGTRRRLRPNAVPTIFIPESLPSEKVKKKGIKRKRASKNDETGEGASSSVLFYSQTSDPNNPLVQQVLPSHLHIVLPSTSLLSMGKPRMYDKAVNTDYFVDKKCRAVGTDPHFGKRNCVTQTLPWKGKSQGSLCTILMGDLIKPLPRTSEPNLWQNKNATSSNIGTLNHTFFPRTSQTLTGRAANIIIPRQKEVKLEFGSREKEPYGDHGGSPSSVPPVLLREIKEERMSPTPESDGTQLSELDYSKVVVKSEDGDSDESEAESNTDVSENDNSSTKDASEGHFSDPDNDGNFTVLKSCLYDLIKLIRCQYRGMCNATLTNVQVKTLGTVTAIDVLCSNGHNSTLYHSEATKARMALGNRLSPSQQRESSETETFFHNFEYDDLSD
ncbi:uncharacterized protein LOC122922941 isoform X1 [Bufo gargarizans]|uniref:uncharacterized protein LOC122922941 isoform X1 n=1 Tax=Bufo gargarizans TaxID=30331 RepID=UPI001CF2FCBA|nr:uncharacterized protein LOC122922941 isoform X1 [Bufo gargarizans]XP_044129650.1 uncharacterized protein LOC122922941 isoform X1 [Bufo gargarizans]